jgi:hypothetical protein
MERKAVAYEYIRVQRAESASGAINFLHPVALISLFTGLWSLNRSLSDDIFL